MARYLNQGLEKYDYKVRTPNPTPDGNSDDYLLSQVAVGDEKAFDELYQRFGKSVFNYLFQMVRLQEEAEDILQEVFLAVWRGAAGFRGKASVKTWVYRIAHNQAVSWLRSKRQVSAIDDMELSTNEPALDEVLINRWQAEDILRALESLSPKHRAVLELAFVHDLQYTEIAEIVGCPVGTVKSRVSYALQAIKRWNESRG